MTRAEEMLAMVVAILAFAATFAAAAVPSMHPLDPLSQQELEGAVAPTVAIHRSANSRAGLLSVWLVMNSKWRHAISPSLRSNRHAIRGRCCTAHPSVTHTLWVPPSTSGIPAPCGSTLASHVTCETPRLTPRGFSTAIS